MSAAAATGPQRGHVPPRPMPATPIGRIRVTGTLAADAHMAPTLGTPPRMLLTLQLQPIEGLPYLAQVDLGDDAADHMRAQALLPGLRRGAAVSVAAQGLRLRTDHGQACLVLLHAHAVLVLGQPIAQPTAQPTAQQEG